MAYPQALNLLLQPADSFDARPALEWLIEHAVQQQASDLHLRPGTDQLEVLLRRDGVLRLAFPLPLPLYPRLLVGLKNASKLASYKNATPQDGKWQLGSHQVRVAVAPTQFGEVAVLRLLRPDHGLKELDQLGFWPDELQLIQAMADQPQGLVLATGPAGSGKSTTLLALMRWLQQRHSQRLGPTPGARLNVVTLEDPVEVLVADFNQTSIQSGLGMTFATGLRSLLRQDPDLILVGEIRDPETASAVVQASLSGHLVFSTLHARNSLGVLPRLLEMGCQPYQLAAALSGVIYQRLLRQLCAHCKQPDPDGHGWNPTGCEACGHQGYQGRAAVAELLRLNDEFRQAVMERRPLPSPQFELAHQARLRVRQGLTSQAECDRVIPSSG